MKGLRVGGKALVIKAYTDPTCVGKVVELVEFVLGGNSYHSPITGNHFFVDETSPVWVCLGDVYNFGVNAIRNEYGYGIFGPEQLMPLDDPDTDITEKEKDLTLETN